MDRQTITIIGQRVVCRNGLLERNFLPPAGGNQETRHFTKEPIVPSCKPQERKRKDEQP